jgi:hypothetical protein
MLMRDSARHWTVIRERLRELEGVNLVSRAGNQLAVSARAGLGWGDGVPLVAEPSAHAAAALAAGLVTGVVDQLAAGLRRRWLLGREADPDRS